MTTAKAKLAASERRHQRANDEFSVMVALAYALNSEHQRYAESSDLAARLVLFSAGLHAAEIERSLARLHRRSPWIYEREAVRDLPAVLEVGRRLVTDHRARNAPKSGVK